MASLHLDEDTLDMIFHALRHPIRREILRKLSARSLTYSELLKELNIDESSFLNYHLRKMEELLIAKKGKEYVLTDVGEICLRLVERIKEKDDFTEYLAYRRIRERLKSKVTITLVVLLTLSIFLLVELAIIGIINYAFIIVTMSSGIAFSAVLTFFIHRNRETKWKMIWGKRNTFLLILLVQLLVQVIIRIILLEYS